MEWYIYLTIVISSLILIALVICFYLYLRIFYNDLKGKPETLEPLKGKLYEPFFDRSLVLIKKALAIPFEQVTLKVGKHRKLCARYYFNSNDAPTAILVHGYKGNGIIL